MAARTIVTLNQFPFFLLNVFFSSSLIEDQIRSRGKQSSSRARPGSTWPRNPEKYCKFESYRGVKSLSLF